MEAELHRVFAAEGALPMKANVCRFFSVAALGSVLLPLVLLNAAVSRLRQVLCSSAPLGALHWQARFSAAFAFALSQQSRALPPSAHALKQLWLSWRLAFARFGSALPAHAGIVPQALLIRPSSPSLALLGLTWQSSGQTTAGHVSTLRLLTAAVVCRSSLR